MWGDIFINPNLPGFLIPPLDQGEQRGLMFFIGIALVYIVPLASGVIIGGKFS